MAIRNRFPTKIPVKKEKRSVFRQFCAIFEIVITGNCAALRERSQPTSTRQIEIFSAPRNYHVPIPYDN